MRWTSSRCPGAGRVRRRSPSPLLGHGLGVQRPRAAHAGIGHGARRRRVRDRLSVPARCNCRSVACASSRTPLSLTTASAATFWVDRLHGWSRASHAWRARSENDPRRAADRVGIRELIDAYAHCADRRDADARSRIEYPVPHAEVARLAAQVVGAVPQIVAVELSGTFTGVTVPNGTFGRADGTAVGFVTRTSAQRDWHLASSRLTERSVGRSSTYRSRTLN